jgi:thioredoxin 2
MRQDVCPACSQVNRLPAGKDPKAAKCGRCGERLYASQPVEVDATRLAAHRHSDKGAAVLVDVWAPWCGPCRAMAPQYAAAARELEPDVRLLKLNSDAEPQAAGALGVQGIPALILFRDGQVIARTAGAMPAAQIVAWTREAIARAGEAR